MKCLGYETRWNHYCRMKQIPERVISIPSQGHQGHHFHTDWPVESRRHSRFAYCGATCLFDFDNSSISFRYSASEHPGWAPKTPHGRCKKKNFRTRRKIRKEFLFQVISIQKINMTQSFLGWDDSSAEIGILLIIVGNDIWKAWLIGCSLIGIATTMEVSQNG